MKHINHFLRNVKSLVNKDVAKQIEIENEEALLKSSEQELNNIPKALVDKQALIEAECIANIEALKHQCLLDKLQAVKENADRKAELEYLISSAKLKLSYLKGDVK